MLLTVSLPLAAQAPGVRVRLEYQTAPRALITRAIDLNALSATVGAVNPAVATAQDLGLRDAAAPMVHMQLVLRRTQERQAAFDAQVDALHQGGNPSYHRWLTPQIIGTEFGPSATDLAALTSYLRGQGFTVNNVGNSGMFIDFSGTVAQVQQSFHTEIHNVQLPNGELHFSAVNEAQLPAALAPLVVGFVALSDIPLARPNYHAAIAPIQPPGQGIAAPRDTVNTGNYAVGPQDFYTIYNEEPLLTASTPINGTGVTIALLEESAINPADVTYFRNLYGVTPNTPNSLVVEAGFGAYTCTTPGKLNTGSNEEGEAILDIQWAGAVAPGANLLFMECAQTSNAEGILLAAQAVVENNLADVMSLSYGQPEGASATADTLINNIWEQAAAQGETVVVSAGDSGADTKDGGGKFSVSGISTSSLSTTAWNVSAGGTDFMDLYNQDINSGTAFGISTFWNSSNGPGLSSAKSYVPETTWNDTCASSLVNAMNEGAGADGATYCGATSPSSFDLVAGGGGPSKLHARPAWQTGTVYGLPTTTAAPNRLEPDVSLFASNGIWAHTLPLYQSDSAGTGYAGGTSFVAPQLAGVFALIKQATGERQGQPNYVLYNMAGKAFGVGSYSGSACNGSGASGDSVTTSLPSSSCIFYDVQTGNIAVDCKSGTPNCYVLAGNTYGIVSTSTTLESPAYATGAGWDEATGIGSLNITNLVNSWQNSGAGGVQFTPTVSVSATAAAYTYGLPTAITYTATVSGSGSFPTGSVGFSGSPTLSTIGTDPLTPGTGCSSGSSCTETATQAYTAPATLPGGVYTINATYSSTNENYTSATGSTPLTVNAQTPTVQVSPVSIVVGAAAANLSATVTYNGSGLAPAGGLTFRVDSGVVVTATCTGSSSPLTCTYTGYNTSALVVGSHTITAVSLADGNYALATGAGALTVQPLPTITFNVPTHHTMDTPFTVTATSNSSGAITYSVVSGPATISGNTVTLTGAAGTVVLQASQAAGGSYGAGMQNASFPVIRGSVWLGNATSTLSAIDLTGSPISSSSGFAGAGLGTIAGPLGLAFDSAGNMWVASSNGVSEFSRQGTAITTTAYTAGGINSPQAVAIDGAGQVWVANANGTVSVLANTGAAITTTTGYSAIGLSNAPGGIAIDVSGSVWIPNRTTNSVTRILGAAVPVVPLATGTATTPGIKP